tara:strand:+ start:20 stop:853 length:834 start_codon:yes stop_codon:yes gene_type:complete
MAQVIKPKRSYTAGDAPTTSDLVEGEIAINTADAKLYIRDNSNNIVAIAGGGGTASGATTEVTQSSHGLNVKDCIRHNGSAWVKAQADDAATLALGVVTAKADANTFTVAQSGRFELSSHGLTVGQWYYLSADTAGLLTTTEPTISQPLVYVEGSNHVFVYPYRPTNLLVNGGASVVPGDGTVTLAKMAVNSIDSDQYVDGSIDTVHIADNAVTLAKMAGGTDGNLISYDANGDPVAVATGNAGQLLTSAGAGAPPTFADAPASGPSVGKAFFMGQL